LGKVDSGKYRENSLVYFVYHTDTERGNTEYLGINVLDVAPKGEGKYGISGD
jgi:hypothetical protein